MENQSRIEELLAEVLIKQDEFKQELKEMKAQVSGLKSEMSGVRNEVVGLKHETVDVKHEVVGLKEEVIDMKQETVAIKQEMYKLNMLTAENARAILKLADSLKAVLEHEKRIAKLEVTVFK